MVKLATWARSSSTVDADAVEAAAEVFGGGGTARVGDCCRAEADREARDGDGDGRAAAVRDSITA